MCETVWAHKQKERLTPTNNDKRSKLEITTHTRKQFYKQQTKNTRFTRSEQLTEKNKLKVPDPLGWTIEYKLKTNIHKEKNPQGPQKNTIRETQEGDTEEPAGKLTFWQEAPEEPSLK